VKLTHEEATEELKAQMESQPDRKLIIFDDEGNRMMITDINYDKTENAVIIEVCLVY
jgi:hypothetical protein